MREGDWIAMPGVPLIAAGNPEAAVGVEGDGASAPGDDARATEEATRPKSDNMRVDRAAKPSDEAERAEAAVETVVSALTSPGAAAVPEEDAAPSPDEVIPTTASTEENARGDASEMAHVVELEATLLAASSPGHEAPRSPRPLSQPRIRSSPPKPRSEGHRA
jgi:hypothetical protein